MRSLTPDEARLWAKVATTIRPLSRDPINSQPTQEVVPATAKAVVRGRVPPVRPEKVAPATVNSLQGATLDGGWDRRLKTGRIEPDRLLDLHGHSLDRAWEAIDRSLEQAIGAGQRVILLITGHERPGDRPLARGKIRAAVHDWLAASRHAPSIAAVRGAHPRHGGGGSLYIILRRR